MRIQTLLCASLGSPAIADVIACDMSGTPVQFEIDRTQFAPPQDVNEPHRRKVTTVKMGDAQFQAEPILIGDIRGFWAEDLEGTNVMLLIQSDGSAVYTDIRADQRLTGSCEMQQ